VGSLARRTPRRWPLHGESPDCASTDGILQVAIDGERAVDKGREYGRRLRCLLAHGCGHIDSAAHRRCRPRPEPLALRRPPRKRCPTLRPRRSLHPQRGELLADPARRLPPSTPPPQRSGDRRHHVEVAPRHGLGRDRNGLAAGLALVAPHRQVMNGGLGLGRQRSPRLPGARSMPVQTKPTTDGTARRHADRACRRPRLLDRWHLLQPPLDTPTTKRHNGSCSWVWGHLSSGAERNAEPPNSGRSSHLFWGAMCHSCLSSLLLYDIPGLLDQLDPHRAAG
jgi:hypothetical protein